MKSKLRQIELQDVLLLLGIGLFLGGIAHFSAAVAAIVAGLLCFGLVLLIERAKTRGVDGSDHK